MSSGSANRPGRNHTEVVRLFDGHGLISAYHTHHEEKQGAEMRPTYYFYRHRDKPSHIDYGFVPNSWKLGSVEVGSFREWEELSDHVPVVVGCEHQAVRWSLPRLTSSPMRVRWAEPLRITFERPLRKL
jgi:hypothetical protein